MPEYELTTDLSSYVLISDTFDQWRMKTNEWLSMTNDAGSSNTLKTNDTTNATSNTTGAIRTAGGMGIASSMTIGGNLTVHGDSDFGGALDLDAVDIDGAVQIDGTVTVGIDDTGYDVKFFGDTTGQHMLWDESEDELVLAGDTKLSFHDAAGDENIVATSDGHLEINAGTTLDITAATVDINAATAVNVDGPTQINNTVTVGVDDTGYDVKFFGATASAFLLWDASEDDLILSGVAGLSIDNTTDATNTTSGSFHTDGGVGIAKKLFVGTDLDVDGTTNLDAVDVDGAVNFAADVTFADGADIITASAGTSNFRAGVNAGNSIASGGNYNVVIGDEAGTAITTGDQNTFVGYASGDAVTTSSDNTAVGKSSMSAMIDGASNTAVGLSALSDDTKGSKSTGIGYQALSTQNFTSATDSNNTAVGYNAGSLITTGIFNTIMGGLAGDALSDADYNVALGGNSLSTDTLGHQSVAVGYGALNSQNFTSSTNSLNTAVGYRAGTSLTTGTQNTAVGNNALTGVVTGTGNAVYGNESGNSITSGAYNTLIGRYSADSLTTGSYNTHLGNDTDTSTNAIEFGVAIGHGAVDKGTNTGFIAPTSGVYQGNNSTAWTATSDERIKKNIVDNTTGLAKINDIKIRSFDYRTINEITDFENPKVAVVNVTGTRVGVIAQEIKEVLPDVVIEQSSGILSVDPTNLTWYLINAVQELSAKNDALEARIKTLEG